MIYKFIIGGCIAMMLTACSGNNGHTAGTHIYDPTYASGFVIDTIDGGVTEIIVSGPWEGADSSSMRRLRIVPEGTSPSSRGSVMYGRAKRIVAMSSTHVAMLDALGAVDRVVGVSGKQYISNEYVITHDDIVDVGYEASPDYEAIVSVAPDLVLLYGIQGVSPMESKLRELGIPYLYVGDYVEQSPLGKAEWMVALAHVIGKRDAGVKIYDEIPERYNALCDRIKGLDVKPIRVMVNTPYADTWMMPPRDSYTVRLITDAGGQYVYDNGKSISVPIDIEQAYLLADGADRWINTGMASSMSDIAAMCPKFVTTKPYKSGEIYNSNRRQTASGGNDFFESGIVHPDLVLADLFKIFHPELAEDYEYTYYQQLK